MTTPFAFAKVVATLGDIYSRQGLRLFHLIYKQLIREYKTFSNGILPLHTLSKGELESFLFCRFLDFKDAKAKTQPHKNGCPHTGKKVLFSCGCPRRLAYSTLDSYIGKLRSIFAEAGRQGDWNRTLLPGNPATDDLVKIYLKQVTVEQLLARVTPKQAFPFFPDKLLQLSNHLKRRLALPTLNTAEQFVTALDQAFFKTLFYSGDRAGNLGQVKTAEIARFPQ